MAHENTPTVVELLELEIQDILNSYPFELRKLFNNFDLFDVATEAQVLRYPVLIAIIATDLARACARSSISEARFYGRTILPALVAKGPEGHHQRQIEQVAKKIHRSRNPVHLRQLIPQLSQVGALAVWLTCRP